MIEDGDKIGICISGGKDSMLLAKCFQELKRHGKNNFDIEFYEYNNVIFGCNFIKFISHIIKNEKYILDLQKRMEKQLVKSKNMN